MELENGEAMDKLDEIMAKREEIHALAEKYKVRKVFVFGSCARREDTPNSDIDFLVDFNRDSSWCDYRDFRNDLGEMFHCKIDLVARIGINPYLQERIERDSIEI